MTKRVVVFIDNSNVYKNLCKHITDMPQHWCVKAYDPLYLAEKLVGNRDLIKVLFYCAPPPQSLFNKNPDAYNKQNTYYAKVGKLDKVDVRYASLSLNDGVLSEKNLDTQLTGDMVMMAALNEYDHAIVISNDGDFVSGVENAKKLGKKVEVAHFKEHASMDLRQKADITRRLRPSYFSQIIY